MSTQNRKFLGIWIPADLWLDETTSITEKALLVEIKSLDNDDGCTAGNPYFAKFFKLRTRQVSKYIGALRDRGLIEIQLIGRNKRRMIITKKGYNLMEQKFVHDSTKVPSADSTKVPHSNTEDNNIINISSAPTSGARETGLTYTKEIPEIIDAFRTVDPNWRRLFGRQNQRKAVERLLRQHGRPALEKIVAFLPRNNEDPYAPKITSPIQLEEKMGSMVAHWKQKQNKSTSKIAVIPSQKNG